MPGEYSTESLHAHFDNTNRRLAAIEAQLERLSALAGVPYSTFAEENGIPADVVALAAAGDRLGAVKKLRELTGVGFEAARDIVAGL